MTCVSVSPVQLCSSRSLWRSSAGMRRPYEFGGGAPWCVSEWGVDGGLSNAFPLSVRALHDALGVPLQLYAPYFCNNSQYFEPGAKPLGGWKAFTSNTSLDGCGGYLFKVPAADCVFFATEPLPRGGTGKTLKRVIREGFWQGRDRAI